MIFEANFVSLCSCQDYYHSSELVMGPERTLHLNLLDSVVNRSLYDLKDVLDWCLRRPDLYDIAVVVQQILVEIPPRNHSGTVCRRSYGL